MAMDRKKLRETFGADLAAYKPLLKKMAKERKQLTDLMNLQSEIATELGKVSDEKVRFLLQSYSQSAGEDSAATDDTEVPAS